MKTLMLSCLICQGKKCKKSGSKEMSASCKKFLHKKGYEERCKLMDAKCLGYCKKAPVVFIKRNKEWLFKQDKKSLKSYLKQHLNTKEKKAEYLAA